MIKTVLQVEGMMCPHCEAHVNEAIREAFQVQEVSSSHEKKETQILSAEPLDEAKLKEVITKAGYTLLGVSVQ